MKQLIFIIWMWSVLFFRTIKYVFSLEFILEINSKYNSLKEPYRFLGFLWLIIFPGLFVRFFFDGKTTTMIYVSLLSFFVFLRMVPVIHKLLKKDRNGKRI